MGPSNNSDPFLLLLMDKVPGDSPVPKKWHRLASNEVDRCPCWNSEGVVAEAEHPDAFADLRFAAYVRGVEQLALGIAVLDAELSAAKRAVVDLVPETGGDLPDTAGVAATGAAFDEAAAVVSAEQADAIG